MNYSVKLKKAIQEIDAIMKRYDIGGSVILHTPGWTEFKRYLTPRYSCVKIIPEGYRFRAMKEDFGGDVSAQKKCIEDTVNLISSIQDTSGDTFLVMGQMMEVLKTKFDIDEDKGPTTSHESQNN